MKRRKFLKAAAIAGAAGALPPTLAHAANLGPDSSRFVLLRATSGQAGSAFRALDDAGCIDCATPTVRVRMDAMHVAEGGAVLRELHAAQRDAKTRRRAGHHSGQCGNPGVARLPGVVAEREARGAFGTQQ